MTNSIGNLNTVKSGTCPHGVSPGACPICSGMGGGSLRVGERPQKAGEMSYHQCAMIGAMMKAREARLEAHEKKLEKHAEIIKAFESNLQNAAQIMSDFAAKISNIIILKPIGYTIRNIAVPIINGIKNIPNFIANLGEKLLQIKEKLIDIQDKLNAIFGEAKAFVEKKVSELISNLTNKFSSLLKIFRKNNSDNTDTKIDEDKRIFNLKNIITKIWKKKKDDTEN